jgi:hypothetical protein
MKRIIWLIIVLSVFLVQCSSSSISSSWQASQAMDLKTGRIVVVGLIKESEKSLQRQMENHLADDLCNLGYDAFPSIELYGFKAFEGKDEKEVIDQLKENDIAAVLTIVLLNKRDEKYYPPKSLLDLTNPFNDNEFSIYYTAIYNKIYEEGYYTNDTYYFWESNLFTMPDQKLLYSVQTQSFNPLSTMSLAHEYGKLIIHNMLANNMIQDLHK